MALLIAPDADTAPGDIADLAVTKTDSPDPVPVSSTLTYTIRVTNLGPQGATGVSITDRIPSLTDFVSATASTGNCERKGNNVRCDLGSLAADPTGANAITVVIQVRPTKARTITNSVSVESVENDPVKANDEAAASTTVAAARLPRCRGVTATQVGTPGPDRIVGTTGRDVIVALAGNDRIIARAGRDRICGNRGHDNVIAGPGADRVFGDGGADRLKGRGGPDLLVGNRGNDILKGNRGNDRLRGGRGFDRCYGGSGFDRERSCER
ncbi:MAG TPA: hypothetical protein VFZ41_04085 [Solirubrobacterales bacterium]